MNAKMNAKINRKNGRPPVPKDIQKRFSIQTTLNEREFNFVDDLAWEHRITKSELGRQALEFYLNHLGYRLPD